MLRMGQITEDRIVELWENCPASPGCKMPLNPLDYADNPGELEVQRELQRLGVKNSPRPSTCPKCGAELSESGGYAGETVLCCPTHGVVWEDSEDAIRRVL